MDGTITLISGVYVVDYRCDACGIRVTYTRLSSAGKLPKLCKACKAEKMRVDARQHSKTYRENQRKSVDDWRCWPGECENYDACRALVWTPRPVMCEVR